MSPVPPGPSLRDYRALAEFRYRLRLFLSFSESAARDAGLGPQQHQLLLALKGLPADLRPTIGVLADRLQLRHHTTVELVDRLEAQGLLRRERDLADGRAVQLRLTPRAGTRLARLSRAHRAELTALLPIRLASLVAPATQARKERRRARRPA